MLTRIKVQNFRSIRELDMRLSPFTALVGPNGSGKSTVLAALDPRTDLRPTWRHAAGEVRIERLNAQGNGSLSIRNVDQSHSGHLAIGVQHLRLNLDLMRQAIQLNPATSLDEDGSNLANLISTMSRTDQGLLAKQLSARVAGIADVDVVPSGRGSHRLRFHDRWSKTVFSPDEVSDGTILMLAFLALRFQPDPPDLITIEEPERGLHPYLLGELVSFLRSLTEGPKPTQIVVATHSAEFLEHMKPDEVRFLSRSPDDGNVLVKEVDPADPDWVRVYREFDDSLGSAWLSGGLGGVPSSN
ncbi:MAG: AAA family ATPase [Archangium sp.]|nr:AAA family ATPase [Archangium sp.]